MASTALAIYDQNLLNRKILLLDGGLGTTLEHQYRMKFTSEETPLWSSHLLISSPETLLKAQSDFANAGADVILTATYQASFEGMAKTPSLSHWKHETGKPGYGPVEAKALLISAVGISKEAIKQSGRPGLVALGLGAYGATMIPSQEYTGMYGVDERALRAFHGYRLQAFTQDPAAWRDIDIIAFETLPRIDEIKAVRRAMRSVQALAMGYCMPDGYGMAPMRFQMKPYWISCVFPNDDRLPDGSPIEEVLATMWSDYSDTPLPYAIGINCTKVHKIAGLVKKFEDAAEKLVITLPRLVIYPDGAGRLIYDTAAQKWIGDGSEETPWDEQVFEIVKEVSERGKWKGILVGGCCKTTPEHIMKLKRRLDEWNVEKALT